jgi:anaerobic selenocysteine-containing dehydrogenase
MDHKMESAANSNLPALVSVADDGQRTALRTCPLCEATCGLEITLAGDDVVSIRGDHDDVFSRGFICP